LASLLLALGLAIAWKTGALAAAPPPRVTPSGLPVPRYAALKFGEVNARAGPGDDYRLLWIYRARGLPLQIIAETADWRRVCDPEGAVAWVHQRTVDARRTVMRVKPEPLPMRRRPDPKSPATAELAGRSLAALGPCRGGWCQVSAGRAKGWAPAAELWGTSDAPQCRPTLAKGPP
jgi:SH3-like domain-containing protein